MSGLIAFAFRSPLDEEVTIIEILALLLLLLLLLLSVVHLLRCAVGGLKPELRWGSCCFSFNDLRECAVKEEYTRDMVCVFLILHVRTVVQCNSMRYSIE